LHLPEINELNEQGVIGCYVGIAEMIEKYHNVKGLFGISWLYDPQLVHISPRLIYLQKLPLSNGAKRFYIGIDESESAFVKSKTRARLFKEGKYKPKAYLLVWPRKDIVEWSKRYR